MQNYTMPGFRAAWHTVAGNLPANRPLPWQDPWRRRTAAPVLPL